MQLGAAIGTRAENQQLVAVAGAAAQEHVESPVTIHIAERNRLRSRVAREVVHSRNKAAVGLLQQQVVGAVVVPNKHVETPVAVHIAQRDRHCAFAATRKPRKHNKATVTLLQQQLVGTAVKTAVPDEYIQSPITVHIA
jgi:hypothetical protein